MTSRFVLLTTLLLAGWLATPPASGDSDKEYALQRQKLVQLLRQLDIPVFVLVILQPDDTTIPDPGPLSDIADVFHVLRAGEIEMGLAQI